jgi:hypothetical protein
MKTPILGGSYVAVSTNAACNRMVNLYPELNAEGGKEAGFLKGIPDTVIKAVALGPIRGLYVFKDLLFIVDGKYLYAMGSDYVKLRITEIPGTSLVTMVDNGNQLFISAEPLGFVYDLTSNTLYDLRFYDPNFPGCKTVGYLDGYFVYIEPNTQKLWVTSLLDGTSTNPLDFASAEGLPDNLVSLVVNHREIWLFGTNSIEVWYNAGGADFPFQRLQGAFIETGCAATYSTVKLDNDIFWLGSDQRGSYSIYKTNGYSAQKISTNAVEWQINTYGDVSDAQAFSYKRNGHSFYVLTFPSDDATWVYDLTTDSWHERARFDTYTGKFKRYEINCHCFFNNTNFVGDIYGMISIFSDNQFGGGKWLRSWRALSPGTDDLKGSQHHSLRVDCQTAADTQYYDNYGNPLDPQIYLRWSDDGGHTWSQEKPASIGKVGEYSKKVIFRRLGQTKKLRDRIYELSGTLSADIVINGASLDNVSLSDRKF